MTYKKFTVPADNDGMRLDKFLQMELHIPFALVQKLLRKKRIKINKKKAQQSYRVFTGDTVDVYANLEENATKPQKIGGKLQEELAANICKNIVFTDEYIIAINKPQGIAVQGGSEIKVSIDDILPALAFDYKELPRLVHRIDKHTSGLLLLARTRHVAKELTHYFQQKLVCKKYIAIVRGRLHKSRGTLKSLLGKLEDNEYEKVSTDAKFGKYAVTEYRLIKHIAEDLAVVEFTPITGRTHQIRVHAAEELKCPIVGDFKYGYKGPRTSDSSLIPTSLCLHAAEIEIKGFFGKDYCITAPLPQHMNLLINM